MMDGPEDFSNNEEKILPKLAYFDGKSAHSTQINSVLSTDGVLNASRNTITLPPPLPGVFVFDQPNQKINKMHPDSNVSSSLVSSSYDSNNSRQALNRYEKLEGTGNVFDYSSSVQKMPSISDMESMLPPPENNVYQSLQPVPVNVFDTSYSEPKVYQQLQPVPRNEYLVDVGKFVEQKFYQELNPVPVNNGKAMKRERKTYQQLHSVHVPAASYSGHQSSVVNLTKTTQPEIPPQYATSKLYQQLSKPPKKQEKVSFYPDDKLIHQPFQRFEIPRHILSKPQQPQINMNSSRIPTPKINPTIPRENYRLQSYQSVESARIRNYHVPDGNEPYVNSTFVPGLNVQSKMQVVGKGFQEHKPKVYLELRNPVSKKLKVAQESSQTHPVYHDLGQNVTRPAPGQDRHYSLNNKNQSALRLPGPYEFNLPRQDVPDKFRMPKILSPDEYQSQHDLATEKIQNAFLSGPVKPSHKSGNIPMKCETIPLYNAEITAPNRSLETTSLSAPGCFGDLNSNNISKFNENLYAIGNSAENMRSHSNPSPGVVTRSSNFENHSMNRHPSHNPSLNLNSIYETKLHEAVLQEMNGFEENQNLTIKEQRAAKRNVNETGSSCDYSILNQMLTDNMSITNPNTYSVCLNNDQSHSALDSKKSYDPQKSQQKSFKVNCKSFLDSDSSNFDSSVGKDKLASLSSLMVESDKNVYDKQIYMKTGSSVLQNCNSSEDSSSMQSLSNQVSSSTAHNDGSNSEPLFEGKTKTEVGIVDKESINIVTQNIKEVEYTNVNTIPMSLENVRTKSIENNRKSSKEEQYIAGAKQLDESYGHQNEESLENLDSPLCHEIIAENIFVKQRTQFKNAQQTALVDSDVSTNNEKVLNYSDKQPVPVNCAKSKEESDSMSQELSNSIKIPPDKHIIYNNFESHASVKKNEIHKNNLNIPFKSKMKNENHCGLSEIQLFNCKEKKSDRLEMAQEVLAQSGKKVLSQSSHYSQSANSLPCTSLEISQSSTEKAPDPLSESPYFFHHVDGAPEKYQTVHETEVQLQAKENLNVDSNEDKFVPSKENKSKIKSDVKKNKKSLPEISGAGNQTPDFLQSFDNSKSDLKPIEGEEEIKSSLVSKFPDVKASSSIAQPNNEDQKEENHKTFSEQQSNSQFRNGRTKSPEDQPSDSGSSANENQKTLSEQHSDISQFPEVKTRPQVAKRSDQKEIKDRTSKMESPYSIISTSKNDLPKEQIDEKQCGPSNEIVSESDLPGKKDVQVHKRSTKSYGTKLLNNCEKSLGEPSIVQISTEESSVVSKRVNSKTVQKQMMSEKKLHAVKLVKGNVYMPNNLSEKYENIECSKSSETAMVKIGKRKYCKRFEKFQGRSSVKRTEPLVKSKYSKRIIKKRNLDYEPFEPAKKAKILLKRKYTKHKKLLNSKENHEEITDSSKNEVPTVVKLEFVDPLESSNAALPTKEGLITDDEGEAVFLGFDSPVEEDETVLGFDFKPDDDDDSPINEFLQHLEADCMTVECDPGSLLQAPGITMQCPQCGKSLDSHQDLVDHMQWHASLQDCSYVCFLCQREFNSQAQLNKHIKWNHEGGKRFMCPVCSKRFTTSNYVKKHLLTIHKQRKAELKYICAECTRTFPSEKKLRKHEEQFHKKVLYQCDRCLKNFLKPKNLERHKRAHEVEGEQFPCAYCSLKFDTRDKLHSHWPAHTEKRLFSCDVCNSTFTASPSLKRHKLLHSGEKLFRCEICQKSFTLLSTLKTHLLIHTGVRRFPCKLCDKVFNRQDVLNAHQWVHTGEKKFECDICSQKFRWRHAVKSHKLIYHSTEKPYVCEICNKRFSHPESFKKHGEVHAEKLYYCQICLKAFSRPSSLKLHILIHTDLKPFVCDMCNKGFRHKSHLRKHFLVHTNEKPWLCKYCNRMYKDRCQLRRHKRIVHCNKFFKKVLPDVPENLKTIENFEMIADSESQFHIKQESEKSMFDSQECLSQTSKHFILDGNIPNNEERSTLSNKERGSYETEESEMSPSNLEDNVTDADAINISLSEMVKSNKQENVLPPSVF